MNTTFSNISFGISQSPKFDKCISQNVTICGISFYFNLAFNNKDSYLCSISNLSPAEETRGKDYIKIKDSIIKFNFAGHIVKSLIICSEDYFAGKIKVEDIKEFIMPYNHKNIIGIAGYADETIDMNVSNEDVIYKRIHIPLPL